MPQPAYIILLMKYFGCFLILFLFALQGFSQQLIIVKGTVKTNDDKFLKGASILLYYKGSKDSLKTVSNETGGFSFLNVKSKPLVIVVSYIGYSSFINSYDMSSATGEKIIEGIVLSPGFNTLENVTLESSKVQIKEDTVSFLVLKTK